MLKAAPEEAFQKEAAGADDQIHDLRDPSDRGGSQEEVLRQVAGRLMNEMRSRDGVAGSPQRRNDGRTSTIGHGRGSELRWYAAVRARLRQAAASGELHP